MLQLQQQPSMLATVGQLGAGALQVSSSPRERWRSAGMELRGKLEAASDAEPAARPQSTLENCEWAANFWMQALLKAT